MAFDSYLTYAKAVKCLRMTFQLRHLRDVDQFNSPFPLIETIFTIFIQDLKA